MTILSTIADLIVIFGVISVVAILLWASYQWHVAKKKTAEVLPVFDALILANHIILNSTTMNNREVREAYDLLDKLQSVLGHGLTDHLRQHLSKGE
jgi:Na+-transporting NADH:ubiquinone oxidoreductase subunit NqrD